MPVAKELRLGRLQVLAKKRRRLSDTSSPGASGGAPFPRMLLAHPANSAEGVPNEATPCSRSRMGGFGQSGTGPSGVNCMMGNDLSAFKNRQEANDFAFCRCRPRFRRQARSILGAHLDLGSGKIA